MILKSYGPFLRVLRAIWINVKSMFGDRIQTQFFMFESKK